MIKCTFVNEIKETVYYLKWEIENPKANVVISHGMVEHPGRYDDLAKYLNSYNINVYGIYHIGHGENAKVLNHMGENEFDRCISNLNELIEIASLNQKPTFLLGHSMGSFMSQLYITRYTNIKGLILSGSTKSNFISKAGSIVASVLTFFAKDKTKPCKFLDNMAFGSHNKVFKNTRTNFDWLSQDEAQVDKYIADPYCGGVCSSSFFKNLTTGMANMGKKKYLKNVNLDLRIYIHESASDLVSNMGKGLYYLEKQYKDLGVKKVKLVVYANDRHEIYNELNKQEDYENKLRFIEENI